MSQVPKIVLQDDETGACLVIDPNTNTACWRFADDREPITLRNVMIERLPMAQAINFSADFGLGNLQGSVSLDSRFGSAGLRGLFASETIHDRNVDDSKCDCEKRVDYSVNSLAPNPDAKPGDGSCATADNNCTLWAAIDEVNATAGTQRLTIGFNGLPAGMNTFRPLLPYPAITRSRVCIDGTTHPDGWVVLDGNNISGGNASGLTFNSMGNHIRGLEIRGFPRDGLRRESGGGSVLEWLNIHGNGGYGLAVFSRDNIIRYCNLWDNGGHGLGLLGMGATGNRVSNCNIGTDGRSCAGSDGRPLGNRGEGIRNENAPGNMIGPGNVIGCNSDGGSIIGPNATGNMILSNFIGTDLQCIQDLGNQGAGQGFAASASNNIVKGNVFAFNGYGVIAFPGSRNLISENSIFSNEVLGIDLSFPGGVTQNDAGDRDGAQNFPELAAATQANSTVVRGQFNSLPITTFRLEFFSNPTCHRTGNGEGQFFLGSTMVTTNIFGSATFNTTLPVTVPGSQFLVATATGPAGNTSEFSRCIRMEGSAQPDVALTMTGPSSLRCGLEFFSYSITARNNGGASAVGVIVSNMLPDCLIGSQIITTQGEFTLRDKRLTADLGTLEPGASATITVATSSARNCAPGFSNTASVTLPNDTNVANNTATVTTRVSCDAQVIGSSMNRPKVTGAGTGLDQVPTNARTRPPNSASDPGSNRRTGAWPR
ncbi:MAG: DUF11 domain-containing protein [Acidobacteria bacterium]|nr:DUF11 domain-containing protein [Acidobacteriota bacterium]